jgi:hypothetical protein
MRPATAAATTNAFRAVWRVIDLLPSLVIRLHLQGGAAT